MGEKVLPQWAPRVPQRKIRQLYQTDAMGIYDEELIEEVGYGLLARCESFIAANEAAHGRAPCPVCGAVVFHGGDKQEMLHCESCGWELSWGDYFKTIQHKQLSGAAPVWDLFRAFIQRFPSARSPRERMLLIDELIHGYHWNLKPPTPTRPVAVNLIEGRLGAVIDFLDELSYGDGSTPGLVATRKQWMERSRVVRRWAACKRDVP
ncbi:MAG: hypothetical protein ACP5G7_05950 [Anaerolineae bacterium]